MPLSDMLVANGRGDIEIDPAAAQDAFQEAHDALPSNGGVIEVYGESTLTFTGACTVTKPNVGIRFNHAQMRGGTGLSRCFQIEARGFRAYQPKFVQPHG